MIGRTNTANSSAQPRRSRDREEWPFYHGNRKRAIAISDTTD